MRHTAATTTSMRIRAAHFRAAVAGLALLLAATGRAAPSSPKEYELKAAFLYNFTKFVAWPPGLFPEDTSPFVIGVYGENPFGAGLSEAIRARKFEGRSIELRSISSVEEARRVHLVFFPATEDRAARDVLPTLQNAAVLTVGESDAFRKAAVITFVREGDKLRFVIDIPAARRAGLKISAQLQKLAQHVEPGS